MLNSPVLELVILLSFTYFMGSLILSAINEALAGWLRLRQGQLQKALESMFFEAGWKSFIRTQFIRSPNIQALMKRKGRYPAYISAPNFVQAVIQIIGPANYTKDTLSLAINENAVIPEQFKRVLLGILARAGGNLDEFEKRLEDFYTNVMDRATGWYKRKIRRILLFIGFVLSVILNLDTVKIVNDALKDQNRLSQTIDKITAQLSNVSLRNDSISIKDSAGIIIYEVSGRPDTTLGRNDADLKKLFAENEGLKVIYEQATGYRLGYDNTADFKRQWKENFWKKLLGVFITAFALQLSSNYWFDLMNKAVNIRAVGTKPRDKPENKPK